MLGVSASRGKEVTIQLRARAQTLHGWALNCCHASGRLNFFGARLSGDRDPVNVVVVVVVNHMF